MIKIFFYFIFCFTFLWEKSHGLLSSEEQSNLQSIPLQDRLTLENFFYYLITGSNFGYTLYGNKPLTFEEYYPTSICFNADRIKYSSHMHILNQGWKTWEKYRSKFPIKRYIFTCIPSRSGYHFITLINIEAFLKTVDANLDLFKSILGEEVNGEKLLEQFSSLHSEDSFESILGRDSALIGIALGYGRENSLMYKQREEICKEIRARKNSLLASFEFHRLNADNQRLLNGQEYKRPTCIKLQTADCISSGLYEELNDLTDETSSFNHSGFYWTHAFDSPNFVCFPNSQETQQLFSEYNQIRQALAEIYQSGHFLETTLQQLTAQP